MDPPGNRDTSLVAHGIEATDFQILERGITRQNLRHSNTRDVDHATIFKVDEALLKCHVSHESLRYGDTSLICHAFAATDSKPLERGILLHDFTGCDKVACATDTGEARSNMEGGAADLCSGLRWSKQVAMQNHSTPRSLSSSFRTSVLAFFSKAPHFLRRRLHRRLGDRLRRGTHCRSPPTADFAHAPRHSRSEASGETMMRPRPLLCRLDPRHLAAELPLATFDRDLWAQRAGLAPTILAAARWQ